MRYARAVKVKNGHSTVHDKYLMEKGEKKSG